MSLLRFILHYREIVDLLRAFALAESARIVNNQSANREQWSRRVERVEQLGIL